MKKKITTLLNEVHHFTAETKEELEGFRIKLLGSKGQIKTLFADFKNVPNEQKKEVGQLINELKNKGNNNASNL